MARVALGLLLLVVAGAGATDIQVVPTLPPGIWSVVSSGGLNSNTGTYTLGGNSTTFYISSLLLIPFLIAVVALDFGIFGAYATRREDLNPVSKFVYNVREGLNSIRNRQSSHGYSPEDRQYRYLHGRESGLNVLLVPSYFFQFVRIATK
jgi:hypothetical protein